MPRYYDDDDDGAFKELPRQEQFMLVYVLPAATLVLYRVHGFNSPEQDERQGERYGFFMDK